MKEIENNAFFMQLNDFLLEEKTFS